MASLTRMYFRQLSPGVDIARLDSGPGIAAGIVFSSAQQMANFVYLVGCMASKKCVVVDGCWDVEGVMRCAAEDGMEVVGAVATHFHFDHIGGDPPAPFNSLGIKIPGLKELTQDYNLRAYIHESEVGKAVSQTGARVEDIEPLREGSTIDVGGTKLSFIHTPGHSPGSMCVLCRNEMHDGGEQLLLSGDTVFPGSCGRLDLPDSDWHVMYDSLRKISALPGNLRIYPGHSYGGDHSTVDRERRQGFLREMTREEWRSRFGAPKM